MISMSSNNSLWGFGLFCGGGGCRGCGGVGCLVGAGLVVVAGFATGAPSLGLYFCGSVGPCVLEVCVTVTPSVK